MKTLLSLLLLLICAQAGAQTIRRVNNTPGITGTNVYSTLTAAYDDAASGDILYIEPTPTAYGDLVSSKKLTILGNGYFLNTNQELSANSYSSSMGKLTLRAGSEETEIYGMSLSQIRIEGASNIVIKRNYVVSISVVSGYTNASSINIYSNVSGIEISQNFIPDASGVTKISIEPFSSYLISNVNITNNYIGGPAPSYSNEYIVSLLAVAETKISNLIIRNNVIRSSILICNATFENNIITPMFYAGAFQPTVQGGTIYAVQNVAINSTMLNNISTVANILAAGNGNQNAVDVLGDLIPGGAGVSPDEAWMLKAQSTLKTAGSSGSEVGMYGGPTPYLVSGGGATIPTIKKFTTNSTGSSTAPLSVTISTKSNN